MLVFEATAEPARSSGAVAKRWAKIATNVQIVPIEGSHISIVAEPDGRPLTRLLGQKLWDISQPEAPETSLAEGLMLPAIPIAAMLNRNPVHPGDVSPAAE